jgi:hypothetical protein
MKKIFLYAPRDSATLHQLEGYVRTIAEMRQLISLPPGSGFTSPRCLELRSNDIVILYARDDSDIDALLELRNEYESYRIILILDSEQEISSNRYAPLCPRFVASMDRSMEDVSEYLTNILRKALPHQPLSR